MDGGEGHPLFTWMQKLQGYQRVIKGLSERYQSVIRILLEGYQRAMRGLSECYQSVIGGLSEGYQSVIRALSEYY